MQSPSLWGSGMDSAPGSSVLPPHAINGIDMEPHVSVWEYQCLFITCKVKMTLNQTTWVISQSFIRIQPIKPPYRRWLETKCPDSSDNLSQVC